MKNTKRIIALMLLLVVAITSGSMAFAGTRVKKASKFMYNYSYRLYEEDGQLEWNLKIPNHPTIVIYGANDDAENFRRDLDEFDDQYDRFKKLAKPSKSLKTSDPEEYKHQYTKYQIMRRVLQDNMSKTNIEVLQDYEELRTAFYLYKDKHYPYEEPMHFYGDEVDAALEAGRAISCCIDYYSYCE